MTGSEDIVGKAAANLGRKATVGELIARSLSAREGGDS